MLQALITQPPIFFLFIVCNLEGRTRFDLFWSLHKLRYWSSRFGYIAGTPPPPASFKNKKEHEYIASNALGLAFHKKENNWQDRFWFFLNTKTCAIFKENIVRFHLPVASVTLYIHWIYYLRGPTHIFAKSRALVQNIESLYLSVLWAFSSWLYSPHSSSENVCVLLLYKLIPNTSNYLTNN